MEPINVCLLDPEGRFPYRGVSNHAFEIAGVRFIAIVFHHITPEALDHVRITGAASGELWILGPDPSEKVFLAWQEGCRDIPEEYATKYPDSTGWMMAGNTWGELLRICHERLEAQGHPPVRETIVVEDGYLSARKLQQLANRASPDPQFPDNPVRYVVVAGGYPGSYRAYRAMLVKSGPLVHLQTESIEDEGCLDLYEKYARVFLTPEDAGHEITRLLNGGKL